MSLPDSVPTRRIEEYVIGALQVQLKEIFGVVSKVSVRDTGYEVFSRATEPSPSYPFSFLTLENIDANTLEFNVERVSNDMIRSRVNTTGTNLNKPNALYVGIVPVIMSFNFYYFTNDLNALLDFISRWYFARYKSKLDFSLDYRGVNYSVKVLLEKELTVPKKETPATNSGAFEYQGQITVHGYVSSSAKEDNPVLPLIKSIELDIFIQDLATDNSVLDKTIFIPDVTP